jgi:hypothetical protein
VTKPMSTLSGGVVVGLTVLAAGWPLTVLAVGWPLAVLAAGLPLSVLAVGWPLFAMYLPGDSGTEAVWVSR